MFRRNLTEYCVLWDLYYRYPLGLITPLEPSVFGQIIENRISRMEELANSCELSYRNEDDFKSAMNRPVDFFSGEPIRLIAKNDGIGFYSIGIDRIDDKAQITYDPTNGLFSQGDITSDCRFRKGFGEMHGLPRVISALFF